jgi:hypothetical protein
MQRTVETQSGQPVDTRPERPPNYLVWAIILMLILMPLCLLLGSSSLYGTWRILTGPAVRSEIPYGFRAFMEALKALVGIMGFFMPIVGLYKALKVNSEYNAGNYGGAIAASKAAQGYCRQSVIYLVVVVVIMATDVFRYLSAVKD